MAQGDTTVRIDFEVGGTNAAKMAILDIHKAQQDTKTKMHNAAKAFAVENNMSFRDALSAVKKYLRDEQLAVRKAQAEADANQAKETAKAEQEERRAALSRIKNLEAEEREKKRILREENRERARIAREELRDAKTIAREKERFDRMQEARTGATNKLVGRGLWGAAMGIAGYAGVAGVSSIISQMTTGLEDIASKRAELEKAITPLVSLGDNVNKLAQVRTEVIGLGATMGMSNQDIANFLESLNSLSNTMAAKTLSEIKTESLQLTELAGGDLQTNMRMLAKTNETYGKSFKTVNQEQNKLFKIQQDADVPMSEMAYYMPELMATANQLGISFDEVGAGIIATTVALGRSEGAFTGFRNVLAVLEEAQKKGINLQGSFTERLEQLKKAADDGKVSLIDLFGRDPLAAGGALLNRIDEVKANIKSLSEMGSEGDIVGENLKRKYEDPKFVQARIYELDKSLMENSANMAINAGSDNFFTRMMHNYKLGHHAGAAYAGDFPLVPWAFGVANLFGNESLTKEGERQRLGYVSEGSPLRNKLLETQFQDQKRRDIETLNMSIKNDPKQIIGMGRDKIEQTPEYQAIMARQFDLERAQKDQPSLEKTLAIVAGIDETNALLRDIRDGKTAGVNAKPGGSKTNAEETPYGL